MEKSRPALVNIDDQKIVSAVAGGMHTVCLTNKGEVGDSPIQLHVNIFVRLGPSSFNVLSVLNVVVHAFNCIHKSRYHSFYLLYDTVYTFVMTRRSEFSCTYIVHCFTLYLQRHQSFHVHSLFQVYTFGCNDEGALGRNTSEEGSETLPSKVDLLGRGIQLSAGDSHTAVLTDEGKVFAWGNFRVTIKQLSEDASLIKI